MDDREDSLNTEAEADDHKRNERYVGGAVVVRGIIGVNSACDAREVAPVGSQEDERGRDVCRSESDSVGEQRHPPIVPFARYL